MKTTFIAFGDAVLLALTLCWACSGESEVSSNAPPTPVASPTLPSQPDPCERARAIVRANCSARVSEMGDRCATSIEPKVGTFVDVGTPRTRGPGVFVNFALGASIGPEWFLKEDGRLLTINGIASGACKELTSIVDYFGAQEREQAPARGDTPKTYEGVFDKAGNFLHDDCSKYEIDVAAGYSRELFLNADEPEAKSTKRAARKLGLPLKVASDIYMKTIAKCARAVNTHPLARE